MLFRLSGFAVCLLSALIFVGCGNDKDVDEKDDHDHDHDDHAHYHAPHGVRGGHIAIFKSADGEEVMIEHVEKAGANLVEFYTVENKDKNHELRALAIEKFTIVSKTKDSFELMPVDPKEGMASKFQAQDKNLIVAMDLGVDASFELDGVEYKAQIFPSRH